MLSIPFHFVTFVAVFIAAVSSQTVNPATQNGDSTAYAIDACPTLCAYGTTCDGSSVTATGGHYFVGRAAMRTGTQPKSPHTASAIAPCGVAGLSTVSSAQPLEILIPKEGATYSSYEEINAFSLIRKPEVNYVSFTMSVQSKDGSLQYMPAQSIVIGSKTTSSRRLLKGSSGGGGGGGGGGASGGASWGASWGRSGGSYGTARRRASYTGSGVYARRRGYTTTYMTHRRRRDYSSDRFTGGQLNYYSGNSFTNVAVFGAGASFGYVGMRLVHDCNADIWPNTWGYSCKYNYYRAGTSTQVVAQSYSPVECAASCSTTKTCGTTACTCSSCQESGASHVIVTTRRQTTSTDSVMRDTIMASSFMPYNVPATGLKVTITNLEYQKTTTAGTTFSTSDQPSQDLFLVYNEVDSDARDEFFGSATHDAQVGTLALALAMITYFMHW